MTRSIETNSGEYWAEYYVTELEEVYRSILGIEESSTIGISHQLKLELSHPAPSPN
ncbi:MAG: hypothetical protein LH613_16005 [Chamaesiphon sp.]|nr:hypothetical protein [Chamaesiphon sp.]